MPAKSELTQSYLLSVLRYEPETGAFYWLPKSPDKKGFNVKYAGKMAGTVNRWGYLAINVGAIPRRAHRLAWIMMTGEDPPLIDHADGDKLNNRWANLRKADKSLNGANSKIRDDNSSGSKGVSWDSGRGAWAAYINVQGKRRFLGRFASLEQASATYCAAAAEAFGEFARTS